MVDFSNRKQRAVYPDGAFQVPIAAPGSLNAPSSFLKFDEWTSPEEQARRAALDNASKVFVPADVNNFQSPMIDPNSQTATDMFNTATAAQNEQLKQGIVSKGLVDAAKEKALGDIASAKTTGQFNVVGKQIEATGAQNVAETKKQSDISVANIQNEGIHYTADSDAKSRQSINAADNATKLIIAKMTDATDRDKAQVQAQVDAYVANTRLKGNQLETFYKILPNFVNDSTPFEDSLKLATNAATTPWAIPDVNSPFAQQPVIQYVRTPNGIVPMKR